MAIRPQPYRLEYSGGDARLAKLVQEIDEMLQILFTDLADGGGSSLDLPATPGMLVETTADGDLDTRTITAGANITVTDGDGIAGDPTIAVTGIGSSLEAWDADLDAIAALATTGIPARTAANTWALRSVAAGTGIAVTNPAGVAGNPSIAIDVPVVISSGGTGATTAATARTALGLAIGTNVEAWDADLDALAALASSGLVARTGSATYSPRTVTAGTGISVANGDGVSGNPTVTCTVTSGASLAQAVAIDTLQILSGGASGWQVIDSNGALKETGGVSSAMVAANVSLRIL